eukprot:GHVR01077619.1.p1 GENE.GHVR01077619.1~~GHVR01077619.1.p1  ORF type:complete len:247 (+),score=79.13 GHVR01077619.1:335-1075(+)
MCRELGITPSLWEPTLPVFSDHSNGPPDSGTVVVYRHLLTFLSDYAVTVANPPLMSSNAVAFTLIGQDFPQDFDVGLVSSPPQSYFRADSTFEEKTLDLSGWGHKVGVYVNGEPFEEHRSSVVFSCTPRGNRYVIARFGSILKLLDVSVGSVSQIDMGQSKATSQLNLSISCDGPLIVCINTATDDERKKLSSTVDNIHTHTHTHISTPNSKQQLFIDTHTHTLSTYQQQPVVWADSDRGDDTPMN